MESILGGKSEDINLETAGLKNIKFNEDLDKMKDVCSEIYGSWLEGEISEKRALMLIYDVANRYDEIDTLFPNGGRLYFYYSKKFLNGTSRKKAAKKADWPKFIVQAAFDMLKLSKKDGHPRTLTKSGMSTSADVISQRFNRLGVKVPASVVESWL